jgi:hypothetical protein
MGNKPVKKKSLLPFTYIASYFDIENNIKVYARDLTAEEQEDKSKQVILNIANSLLRPYGVVAHIENNAI